MSTRDTNVIFKHLKSLINLPNLPKALFNGGRSATKFEDKANLLNDIFRSVYTPKHYFSLEGINSMNPTLTNFCILKQKINRIQSELDIRLEAQTGTPLSSTKKQRNQGLMSYTLSLRI